MFAVILLGVGFIMLAAMFPVAIQQSKSNVDESEAASIARGMANVAQQLGQYTTSSNLFKPTGTFVYSIADPQFDGTNKLLDTFNLWKSLSGDLINADDPRFASVLLYKRPNGSSTAQLFVFVMQARTRDQFTVAQDMAVVAPSIYCNLQARGVNVSILDGIPDTVTFNGGDFNAVAEGCYLVIANDNISGPGNGWMNGRVYRVGSYVGGTTWELMPGNDFSADNGPNGVWNGGSGDDVTTLTNADAFVVGKDISTGSYEGPAQDVAFYTTFISVR
ncbi:MAG: hypothetical protein IT446_05010 [Phycisphaerales bacterium]|nr:hypothetical protein [Phycisphaerales bacterium]